MEQMSVERALPGSSVGECVRLDVMDRRKYRRFAVFLISCALLLAAFAVSGVWKWGSAPNNEDNGVLDGEDGSTLSTEASSEPATDESESEVSIPEGAVLIRTEDLSRSALGFGYLHNETVYRPDMSALLKIDISHQGSFDGPLVLVYHTHTSESYLPNGTAYLTEPIGNVTYSSESEKNVLAVGEALCRTLEENGIDAVHCTVVHDSPTLAGSYERSEKTLRAYLEQYPTVRYVIDLHRDAVLNAEGEYIRAAIGEGDGAVAQVMAVIGTDGNGTPHPNWEANLALSLQLRNALNNDLSGVCRPVSLRNASYHQELAPYSMLLEIGTGANSMEEAQRAAVMTGNALARLIRGTDGE